MSALKLLQHIRSERRRPNFDELAQMIGVPYAPWFPGYLEWSSASIRYDRLAENLHPSTGKQSELIQRTQATIAELRSDRSIAPSLSQDFHRAINLVQKELTRQLRDRNSTDGAIKKGRGKYANIPAKTLCAARVTEIWHFFKNAYPGAGNYNAAAFAEGFWWLSGGKPGSDDSEPHQAWRYQFKRVAQLATSQDLSRYRASVQHQLEQAHRKNRAPWYPAQPLSEKSAA